MSHQDQLPTTEFFNVAKQVLTKYTNLLGLMNSNNVPQWVKEVGSALNGNSPAKIISGRNKVVVINIKENNVYTLEILSEKKMLQKELIYNTLGRIPVKIQLKLPLDRFHIPLDEKYEAYFTKTEYCADVMYILEQDGDGLEKMLYKYKTTLDEQFLLLMQTYETLCEHDIYLIDIKPDNMILCSDGLYFIDVDDITIAKTPGGLVSFITTPAYVSKDWTEFVTKAFGREHGYSLPEIQIRYEYEGWQALIKTYFSLQFNTFFDYDMIEAQLKKQSFDPLLEQKQHLLTLLRPYSVNILKPSYIDYFKETNLNIRGWLCLQTMHNKVYSTTAEEKGGGKSLSSRIQLRF